MTTKPVLQNIFKEILHIEGEAKCSYENTGKNKSH
jgi:hypothetical protein